MNMTFCVIGWQWIYVALASTVNFLKKPLGERAIRTYHPLLA